VRAQHRRDLRNGAGWVELPTALERKYPTAGRDWRWQWVSPASRRQWSTHACWTETPPRYAARRPPGIGRPAYPDCREATERG